MNRRSFLGTTTLLGAGLAASSVFAVNLPAGTKKVKVGLIGCGGRGNGALDNFIEACKILGIEAEVVATGDAFKDRADGTGKKFGLGADRCFGGYDAYQKVVASACDFVLMATPPAFRPVHLAAAVEAGKHCFIEKPVAVDPAGARAVIATGEKAKAKGLAIVAGTQRRHPAPASGGLPAQQSAHRRRRDRQDQGWRGAMEWHRALDQKSRRERVRYFLSDPQLGELHRNVRRPHRRTTCTQS